jgi:hypothetical protein
VRSQADLPMAYRALLIACMAVGSCAIDTVQYGALYVLHHIASLPQTNYRAD